MEEMNLSQRPPPPFGANSMRRTVWKYLRLQPYRESVTALHHLHTITRTGNVSCKDMMSPALLTGLSGILIGCTRAEVDKNMIQ